MLGRMDENVPSRPEEIVALSQGTSPPSTEKTFKVGISEEEDVCLRGFLPL